MSIPKLLLEILTCWAMQAVSQLLYKWGTNTGHMTAGFVVGNLFGASSIVFLMLLYKTVNPNVALGICMGGGFLTAQIALALVGRARLGRAQYAGIVAITAGMLLLAVGKAPKP
jgi:multidrug transporter EmrE-like cation transporter